MQLVFINRLERWRGGHPEQCHVYIGEDQGVWTAGWRPFPEEHPPETGEIWYEGLSWEELLASFRHGVARIMRDGFRPLVDGMLEDVPFWERKPPLQTLLRCYAEMQPAPQEISLLKAWRRDKAAAEKRAAYLVATNRELHMLAVYAPHTPEELQQIPGFGRWKTEKYGAELLELLRKIPRKHEFPLDWVAGRVDREVLATWLILQKERKYAGQLETIAAKQKLLALIREGRTLFELEKELQCSHRELVERIEQLDEEGYDVLPLVERELANLPADELERVEQAFAELGDRYLKPLHERVYGLPSPAGEAANHYHKLRLARIRYRRRIAVAGEAAAGTTAGTGGRAITAGTGGAATARAVSAADGTGAAATAS